MSEIPMYPDEDDPAYTSSIDVVRKAWRESERALDVTKEALTDLMREHSDTVDAHERTRAELEKRTERFNYIAEQGEQLRADLATAQARVAELEQNVREHEQRWLLAERDGMAAESALASARELLKRWTDWYKDNSPSGQEPCSAWVDTVAFLYATPTPAPSEPYCRMCEYGVCPKHPPKP